MDLLSFLGLIIGFSGILIGQALEGGQLESLLNGPALLIVFGGSLGAVMVQSPPEVFIRALYLLKWIILPPAKNLPIQIRKIVAWSHIARKEGLLGLEAVVENEQDQFARKALQLLVDGNEPETIRGILEVDIDTRERIDILAAKVWDGLGGYSPTIGIIGAVIGLIHVMQNLADPAKLGSGVATAFVATIYGVGLANLVFIPVSAKLRAIIADQSQTKDMLVAGVVAIAEGENPRNIEVKLKGYLK